jgi:hypothetical protein
MTQSSLIRRETPWGPMGIADAHVHFFSHRFFETLAAQKAGLTLPEIAARLGASLPPEQPEALAAAWVRELDRNGVAKAALIASIPGDETSVEAAVRAHPDRFFAYAMVNPRAWDPARFAAIQAACLFPAMHAYSMHEDFVRPVFEWAEAASAHRVCALRSAQRRHAWEARHGFAVRYAILESRGSALYRASISVGAHRGAAFRRGIFSGSADACRSVSECVPGYFQHQFLDALPGGSAPSARCVSPGAGCRGSAASAVRNRFFVRGLAERDFRGSGSRSV